MAKTALAAATYAQTLPDHCLDSSGLADRVLLADSSANCRNTATMQVGSPHPAPPLDTRDRQ